MIKSELKWLTGELATARDLDVYVRTKIEPIRGTALVKRGMKELTGALASRRRAAGQRPLSLRRVIVLFSLIR